MVAWQFIIVDGTEEESDTMSEFDVLLNIGHQTFKSKLGSNKVDDNLRIYVALIKFEFPFW